MMVLTEGSMLYTHTLCPLIALGTFIGFAPKEFKKVDAIKAISFTVIYGLIAIILNVMRVMKGPYPFLYVYEQPVWVTVFWIVTIISGAYALSRLILVGKIKKQILVGLGAAAAQKYPLVGVFLLVVY